MWRAVSCAMRQMLVATTLARSSSVFGPFLRNLVLRRIAMARIIGEFQRATESRRSRTECPYGFARVARLWQNSGLTVTESLHVGIGYESRQRHFRL